MSRLVSVRQELPDPSDDLHRSGSGSAESLDVCRSFNVLTSVSGICPVKTSALLLSGIVAQVDKHTVKQRKSLWYLLRNIAVFIIYSMKDIQTELCKVLSIAQDMKPCQWHSTSGHICGFVCCFSIRHLQIVVLSFCFLFPSVCLDTVSATLFCRVLQLPAGPQPASSHRRLSTKNRNVCNWESYQVALENIPFFY